MDAMHVVAAARPETLAELVARRLRGYLAEHRISHKEFGEMVNWDRGKYQRRLAGEVALDLQDLDDIDRNTPITVSFLITGLDTTPPQPPATRQSTPRRGRRVVQLRTVETEDAEDAVANEVDEDAVAYVALCTSLPRVDSNHQPFGQRFAA